MRCRRQVGGVTFYVYTIYSIFNYTTPRPKSKVKGLLLPPQRESVIGGNGRREGGRGEREDAVVRSGAGIVSGNENPAARPPCHGPERRYDRPEFVQC